MIKKTITSLCLALSCFILIAATIKKSSAGAPASHTGAPNEKTCATSGCHDDNEVNNGTALLSVSLSENVEKIIPGKTYPIKVRITDLNVSRFGFQIVALESKTSKNEGVFGIVDSVRTQTVKNAYGLKERNYVTYTFNGTDAVSSGVGEWIVNWTAPLSFKKSITFYVAGVSANDDMSDKGDKVYTTSLTIKN